MRIWRRSGDVVGVDVAVVEVVGAVAVVGVAVGAVVAVAVAVGVEVEREAGGLREADEREHEGEYELSEEEGVEVADEDLEVTK